MAKAKRFGIKSELKKIQDKCKERGHAAPNLKQMFRDARDVVTYNPKSSVCPVGLACSVSENEFLTLERFMEKYKDMLLPEFWFVVVSGNLSFKRTFMLYKEPDIWNASAYVDLEYTVQGETYCIDDGYEEKEELKSGEIRDRVINSDILERLKEKASEKQWKEVLNLGVYSGLVYIKDLQFSGAEEWQDAISKEIEQGRYLVDVENLKGGRNRYIDTRTRAWYSIPRQKRKVLE
jgi:hypothetical protein